jgi:predicted secreted Zn-dependent protease
MRGMVGLAVALLGLSTPHGLTPEIRETTTFYDVSGRTADQLRDTIDRARPLGSDGRRVDALASWRVDYSYQTAATVGGCRLRRLTVSADISMTLPRWVDKPATKSALTDRWGEYVAALISNLSGIRDIGRRAAASLHERIWKLPAQPRCESLEDVIRTTADGVIQQHLRENEDYNKALQEDPGKAARFP